MYLLVISMNKYLQALWVSTFAESMMSQSQCAVIDEGQEPVVSATCLLPWEVQEVDLEWRVQEVDLTWEFQEVDLAWAQ